ncbi:hypothetical protein Acsp06_59030 [Actinomycetospora sp. NBRC 106375]|uniref:hypothetical protein n=1 Tax=Actinomycetospora sp. NBRC 106375 TaxID=3032207 RepID=UPI0024A251AB|nr:hypothetical protein [Actinomycetospora sp. NBRC 106375]GLZ49718.1 hypothetical protein Acsp06_59030 [Actinomycetospora sp. NBRC 106375]
MGTDRFDGWIAGVGTAAGLRVVVGHWPSSPFGAFTDVMVERPDGRRILLVPDAPTRDFVTATYTFDEVRLGPVTHRQDGADHHVTTAELDLTLRVGRRAALGWLLRAVPAPLATAPAWITAIDAVARRVLPGVRTVGTAGGGRREYYGARDLHRVTSARVRWDGVDQGPLTAVSPPVRFGFGSTPRTPSLVRITTLIRHDGAAARLASET